MDENDWERLYGLLSECFKHPDEQFTEDVSAGRLESELAEAVEPLGVEFELGVDEGLVPETEAAFDNEYIALFEAFETPYAPIVESPYKEWYEGPGSDGLLNGPPAEDMQRRYAAMDIDFPDAYLPDHLALLLEYASILVEAGTPDQHRAFVADHLDWIPAFRRLVEEAAAESQFHRRYVRLTGEIFAQIRNRLDIDDPTTEAIDDMIGRVEQGREGVPDEKEFRE
ncbi:MAG: molecular chaperone TorD family protein [Halodesulfurarchaeum sp.]|nr:molecular chaperone TorD family protein [Halodesulfurarchaeum sp.]